MSERFSQLLKKESERYFRMKPPISYYGGKQRMAHKIIPLIPKHMIYVEPFAGGCAVLFQKPYPAITNNDHYREVINDTDSRLINFFTQLRDNGDELVRRIRLTLYSEEDYQISKDLDTGDSVENARRYYVNIQQSFGNKINGGWGRNKIGTNKSLIWKNQSDKLDQYTQRLRGVYACSTDVLKCIKQWDSPNTFFYCDPPYIVTNQGHYGGYTEDDYSYLCNVLDDIKGSFLLSGYDSDIPNKNWGRKEFDTRCSVTRKRDDESKNRRVEVVWSKPSSYPPSELASKLYASGKFDCFTGK